jgi:hypothetical protein
MKMTYKIDQEWKPGDDTINLICLAVASDAEVQEGWTSDFKQIGVKQVKKAAVKKAVSKPKKKANKNLFSL